DGCAQPKAGKVARDYRDRSARSLTRDDAGSLLAAMRAAARPVAPDRLGCVGKDVPGYPAAYAKKLGTFSPPGARGVQLPFVVEAWAERAEADRIRVSVNRTPITAEVDAYHNQKRKFSLSGCGLNHYMDASQRPLHVCLNVETPHMPITTDGKAPDLSPLVDAVGSAIMAAARKAGRLAAAGG